MIPRQRPSVILILRTGEYIFPWSSTPNGSAILYAWTVRGWWCGLVVDGGKIWVACSYNAYVLSSLIIPLLKSSLMLGAAPNLVSHTSWDEPSDYDLPYGVVVKAGRR